MSNQTRTCTKSPRHKILPAIAALFFPSSNCCVAFHPPAMHRHPAYEKYRYSQLEGNIPIVDEAADVDCCYLKYCLDTGLPVMIDCCELDYCGETGMVIDASIGTAISYDVDTGLVQTRMPVPSEMSTPVSYDETTGMVQTAVRTIIKHPIFAIVDNSAVALSSSIIVTGGALSELLHTLPELADHASGSNESFAVLSLGHVLHYGREAMRQLAEIHDTDMKEQTKQPHNLKNGANLSP